MVQNSTSSGEEVHLPIDPNEKKTPGGVSSSEKTERNCERYRSHGETLGLFGRQKGNGKKPELSMIHKLEAIRWEGLGVLVKTSGACLRLKRVKM